MTDPKTPDVDEIIEFVGVVDWRFVTLALVLGAAIGAAILYAMTVEIRPDDRG